MKLSVLMMHDYMMSAWNFHVSYIIWIDYSSVSRSYAKIEVKIIGGIDKYFNKWCLLECPRWFIQSHLFPVNSATIPSSIHTEIRIVPPGSTARNGTFILPINLCADLFYSISLLLFPKLSLSISLSSISLSKRKRLSHVLLNF